MGPRIVESRLQGGREPGIAEGHEDDVRAVVRGVHDSGDDVGVLSGAIGSQDGDRHDAHARVADAGHLGPVVGLGGEDAGHPGAMAVGVG